MRGASFGYAQDELISLSSSHVGQGLGTSLGAFAVFFSFFSRGGFLFGLELLDAAQLIDEAHLTSEEGMALGADVHGKIGLGGASLESGTARAGDGDLIVLWVDTRLHRGVL